jgi:hypothetical protein
MAIAGGYYSLVGLRQLHAVASMQVKGAIADLYRDARFWRDVLNRKKFETVGPAFAGPEDVKIALGEIVVFFKVQFVF